MKTRIRRAVINPLVRWKIVGIIMGIDPDAASWFIVILSEAGEVTEYDDGE